MKIKQELVFIGWKELSKKKFEAKFESLDIEKAEKAKKQETFKEILATSSVSKI